MDSFRRNLVEGIKINEDRINYNLENSLMTVTAFKPIIGYENSAKLAKYAHEDGLSLLGLNRELKLIGEEELKRQWIIKNGRHIVYLRYFIIVCQDILN